MEGAGAGLDAEPIAQQPLAPVADEDAPKGEKRPSSGSGKEKDNEKQKQVDGRSFKRPRWGDKSFEEITIGDVEKIVRQCNSLEKQLEANADAASQLKDLQREKKDLEKQMSDVGPEAVANVKSCLAKQFLSQMVYVYSLDGDIKKGREISAWVPNVSVDLLKALGGGVTEGHSKNDKMTRFFFDPVPSKTVPPPVRKGEKPSGTGLTLVPWLTLHYVKRTSELHVITAYKFGTAAGKPSAKGKAKAKSKALAKDAKEAAAEEGEEGEDGERSEGGEDGEEAAAAPAPDDVDAKEDEEEEQGQNEALPEKVGNDVVNDAFNGVAVGGQ